MATEINKKIYESVEEEIQKLEKEALEKAYKNAEVELNKATAEYIRLYNQKNGDKESLKEAKNNMRKWLYKKNRLKQRLDEEEPEKTIERERLELRKKARKVVKDIANGKLQVDSFVLRMLLVHSAGQVPYLEGETGIGKSERIRQYAELMGMKYVKVMLTGKEKVHIEGNIIPEVIELGEDPNVDAKIKTLNKYVERGEATSTHNERKALLIHKNTIPEYLNQVLNALAQEKHVLLHFDEFLRADREVFNTIMDFILENYVEAFQGRLKTGRLHKVASGNPVDIYDGQELDPAQKQRFVFMKVKPNLTEFLKVVAPKKDIHPAIAEFLQEHPAKDAFHTAARHREMNGAVGDAGGEYIGINPRKWTMISELLKVYEEDYANDPDTKELMLNIMEETLIEDAESYGEKELIKKFINKYKSENKLTLKKIKATLRLHYEDIYYVGENDKESRPLEKAFEAVNHLFKMYEVGTQLDINKKIVLLEDAFNDFVNNFIKPYEIEGKRESEIKKIVMEAIEEDPDKIVPFLAILKSTGEMGVKMVQAKFTAMNLKSEGIDLFSAVDDLFNTTYLTDYVGLSLDTTGNKELKHSIRENDGETTVAEMVGLDLDDFFGDDFDFDDFEDEDNDKKKGGKGDVGD